MRSSRSFLMAAVGGYFLAACSDGSGPGQGPSLDCAAASTENLAVGEHRILDPNQNDACVRLPPAGPAGAEYLYAPVATDGRETDDGVEAPYTITGASLAATAARRGAPSPLLSAFRPPLRASAFHDMLRERERALSRSVTGALFDQGRVNAAAVAKPVVGEVRSFQVCSSPTCDDFVTTTAKARVVADRVAIFVDEAAPLGGYSDPTLAAVSTLFDDFLYPIDINAFGSESDIDGDGVVIVLLTQLVNALSPDCNSTGSVILGYFFGADLLPRSVTSNPGSNEAEIFYGLVPDPGNPDCDISETFARTRLPATFIHEFQHMISFNQHRLIRGASSEDTWLNEGLSHFAEELGARLLPASECPSGCFQDFLEDGNIANAFAYLESAEDFFLIEPGTSTGQLEERGANWLFVRWLADHFATDTVLGTDLTRRLVATSLVGAANVAAQTGVDFATLVPEWQMSNYLDDLPGFDQPGSRLRYKTWNFRAVFPDSLGLPFPLFPDNTDGNGYSRTGVLRAGSGRHVLVTQAAGAPLVDLLLTGDSEVEAISPMVDARIGLVRIR